MKNDQETQDYVGRHVAAVVETGGKVDTLLSNKVYDVIKFCVLILLPALAFAYTSLSGVWGLPHAVEVAATIGILATLLGSLIGITGKQYKTGVNRLVQDYKAKQENPTYDGELIVSRTEGPYVALETDPNEPGGIASKSEVRFTVKPID